MTLGAMAAGRPSLLRSCAGRRTARVALGLSLTVGLPAPRAHAGPEGAQVAHGQVSIQQNGGVTTIEASRDAIINYRSFDIQRQETVRFVQPNETARVLNRVLGADPTKIDGTLLANGQVYILNPQGVFFGGTAVVDVHQLVAGAGHITDSDFLSGIDHLTDVRGEVANSGAIHADVVKLVGEQVANHGSIVAPGGIVMMVAGSDVYLAKPGERLVVKLSGVDASRAQEGAAVTNTGTIDAGDGGVTFAAGDVYSLAVQHSGTTRARDIAIEGGAGGLVRVAGTLDASDVRPDGSGGAGGSVRVTGDRIDVAAARIDASGDAGGGSVLVGGDVRGRGELPHASETFVAADASLAADAVREGDGGQVVVRADGGTRVDGALSARGGAQGGAGGLVETSGSSLHVAQAPDASAPRGAAGTWLLDPANVTIVHEYTAASPAPPAPGLPQNPGGDPPFTPTVASAEILDTTLEAALAAGTSVTIDTDVDLGAAAGTRLNQAGNLVQQADAGIAVEAASAGIGLTLHAANDIVLHGGVAATGDHPLNVTLGANDPAEAAHDLDTAAGAVVIDAPIATNGGDVLVSAATGISSTARGTITTTGPANDGAAAGRVALSNTGAGDVDLQGAIDTRGAANAAGRGSDGGAVTIDTADGSVTTARITTSGGSTIVGTGGDAGAIALTARDADASGDTVLTLNGALASPGGAGPVGGAGAPILLTGPGAGAGLIAIRQDVEAGGALRIQGAQEVDLGADVDLVASDGAVRVVDGIGKIDLSGDGGAHTIAARSPSADDATTPDVTLAPIEDSGMPAALEIQAAGNVTLTGPVSVDVENDLRVTSDADGDTTGAALDVQGELRTAAGSISLRGSGVAQSDDLVRLGADVTAGKALAVSNALRVEVPRDVDLVAKNGALSVGANVGGIVLLGAGGANGFVAKSVLGALSLSPVTDGDAGGPDLVSIRSDASMTLAGVDIENALDVAADLDGTPEAFLRVNGPLVAERGSIDVTGASSGPNDLAIQLNADVAAGGDLDVRHAKEVDLGGDVALSAANGSIAIAEGVGKIDLRGGAGARNTLVAVAETAAAADPTAGSVTLGPIESSGASDRLEVRADGDVTLGGPVSIEGALSITADADGDTPGATLRTADAIGTGAGAITLEGGGAGPRDDVVSLGSHVRAGASLTVRDAATVEVAGSAELLARAGDLAIGPSVGAISLIGESGENAFVARSSGGPGGNVALAPISDAPLGGPDVVRIAADRDVTLGGVEIQQDLLVDATEAGIPSQIRAEGPLTSAAGSLQLRGGGAGDTIVLASDVRAGGTVTLARAGAVRLAGEVDLVAGGGDLSVVDGVGRIELTGAGGTNVLQAGQEGDARLAPLTGGASATVTAGGSADLASAQIGGALRVRVDDNSNSVETFRAGPLSADRGIAVSGSSDLQETLVFDGDVIASAGPVELGEGGVLAFRQPGTQALAGDDVLLNAPAGALSGVRSTVPLVATLTKKNGDLVITANDDVVFGTREKLTVSGNLDIRAGDDAVLSDLVAGGRLRVHADDIVVLLREPGMVLLPDGRLLPKDRGTDFVASFIDFSEPPSSVPIPGVVADGSDVTFGTPTGNDVSVALSGNTIVRRKIYDPERPLLPSDLALAGDPAATLDVAPTGLFVSVFENPIVAAAIIDPRQLGVRPRVQTRLLQPIDILGFLACAADGSGRVPKGCSEVDHVEEAVVFAAGSLAQPVATAPSMEAVEAPDPRLDSPEAKHAGALYQALYRTESVDVERDPAGVVGLNVVDQTAGMRDQLRAAVTAYRAQSGASIVAGAQFARFLARDPDQIAAWGTLRELAELFEAYEAMGLTPVEYRGLTREQLKEILPEGLTVEELDRAVEAAGEGGALRSTSKGFLRWVSRIASRIRSAAGA